MYNFLDFTGKKIVVTGASSGIGRQTAITLSRLGAQLILIARRENLLEETIGMLEGEGHSYYVADLGIVSEIEPLVKRIISEQGKTDGLVYAAGVSVTLPTSMSNYEKCMSAFNVNYFAFIEAVRHFTRKGRFNEGMRIVGISSIAAIRGDKSQVIYSGTKAAMDGSVRSMAKELAEKGICINTIMPAYTDTPMMRNFMKNFIPDFDGNIVLDRQFLGPCLPEDIANTAAFLLSPASRMITGTSIAVDGGTLSN